MECAYCGKEERPTREHIIPNSFIKRMNMTEMTTWLDRVPNKFINGEMVIRDVCAECNNGALSHLDAYAVNLITFYNKKIHKETQSLLFSYEYNTLVRWLLKVCYNSARANNCADDAQLYTSFIEYILYNKTPHNRVLIYASVLELDCKNETYYHLTDMAYDIDHFRICPFRFSEIDAYQCAFRTIMINSFAFMVMVFDNGIDKAKIKEIKRSFSKKHPQFTQLTLKNATKLRKDHSFWGYSLSTHVAFNSEYFGHTTGLEKGKHDIGTIELQRVDIENLNYQELDTIISYLLETRDIALSYMQRIEISISGYDEDSRELYQISDVQKYIHILLEKFPALIFFLNLELSFIKVVLFSYINENDISDSKNNQREININQQKLQQFVTSCFMGLNKLTNHLVLDNSINREITLKFNSMLKAALRVENEK